MSEEEAARLTREARARLGEAHALVATAAMDPGPAAGPRAAIAAAPLEAASRLLDDAAAERGTEAGRELRARSREAAARGREAVAVAFIPWPFVYAGISALGGAIQALYQALPEIAPLEPVRRPADDVWRSPTPRAPSRLSAERWGPVPFRRATPITVEDQPEDSPVKKTYSPQDFRKALTANTLDEQPALEGLVKVDEQDEGVLLFSAAGCERWTPIPLALVREVEHLGSVPCKDHAHPFVRIHLERSESPEARALTDLLAAHVAALRSSAGARRRSVAGGEECEVACGHEFQSCVEGCDPRDEGCWLGCRRQLWSCIGRCR